MTNPKADLVRSPSRRPLRMKCQNQALGCRQGRFPQGRGRRSRGCKQDNNRYNAVLCLLSVRIGYKGRSDFEAGPLVVLLNGDRSGADRGLSRCEVDDVARMFLHRQEDQFRTFNRA